MTTTTTLNADATVGQLVNERPGRARVFERFGIDYCCGGKRPLVQACAERGVDPDPVLDALAESDRTPSDETDTDFSAMPMSELAGHIVETHHAYLRQELPRIAILLDKVVKAHAHRHPELHEVGTAFEALVQELFPHMHKEEQILFPIIHQLESAEGCPTFHCGSVNKPIEVMEHEHDNAGAMLAELHKLTGGYAVPADGCTTYRVLMDSLARLERDLHTHIHKENNILFPRAAARESALAGNAD